MRAVARARAAVGRWVPVAVQRAAAVFVGGALGTALRVVQTGALPVEATTFPWAVWTANVVGSLLLGYLATRFVAAAAGSVVLGPLLCTGVLGAYTTFSSFAVATVQLADGGRATLAVAYALGSVAAGLVAALAGVRLARARA